MAYVPYTIPGFALAKSVAEIYAANPKVEGLILLRHGIFTFAEDARTAYELMIEMVTRAEERIARGKKTIVQAHCRRFLQAWPTSRRSCAARLRSKTISATAPPSARSSAFAANAKILNYVNGAELSRYSQMGVATPDHTIRTKNWPLIVPAPESRQARSMGRVGARRRSMPSSRATTNISRATMRG